MEVTEVTSGAPLWTEHNLEAVLKNDFDRNAVRPRIINVATVVWLYEPPMNQNEYAGFDYLFWVIEVWLVLLYDTVIKLKLMNLIFLIGI